MFSARARSHDIYDVARQTAMVFAWIVTWGISWYIMVYHGISWYIPIHASWFWGFQPQRLTTTRYVVATSMRMMVPELSYEIIGKCGAVAMNESLQYLHVKLY